MDITVCVHLYCVCAHDMFSVGAASLPVSLLCRGYSIGNALLRQQGWMWAGNSRGDGALCLLAVACGGRDGCGQVTAEGHGAAWLLSVAW